MNARCAALVAAILPLYHAISASGLCPNCLGGTSGPCRSPTTRRCYNFVADYDPTNAAASLCPAGTVFCSQKVAPFVSKQFYDGLCGDTTERGHTPWGLSFGNELVGARDGKWGVDAG